MIGWAIQYTVRFELLKNGYILTKSVSLYECILEQVMKAMSKYENLCERGFPFLLNHILPVSTSVFINACVRHISPFPFSIAIT